MGHCNRNCEHSSCIANLEGLCAVLDCRGPIVRAAHKKQNSTLTESAEFYTAAAKVFQSAFSKDFADEDTKE